MNKISVNINDLETAVENFVYASKEAGEINFRLKQLGNELVDDVDLLSSPEYESVMFAYTEAANAVTKINEFFETLLLPVMKTPEMYFDAERKSVEKIKNISNKSDAYQKAIIDNTVLEHIIKSAKENDVDINGLAELVNRDFQNTEYSELESELASSDADNGTEVPINDVINQVASSSESVKLSEIAALDSDD